MLARVPREAPLTVHLQLTTVCNLSCRDCWYKCRPATMTKDKALALVEECAAAGVKSIAIGGGEPMLVDHLRSVVDRAKRLGMWVAVTTNGTVFRADVLPNRVAISWDPLHARTWESGVTPVLQQFRINGVEVGINHVLTSWPDFQRVHGWMKGMGVSKLKDGSPALTLILKKPKTQFNDWDKLKALHFSDFAVDACLAKRLYGVPCRQGETSMYVSAEGLAGVCSNVDARRTYVGLKETFSALPKACLYDGVPCG